MTTRKTTTSRIGITALIILSFSLSGCGALHTSIKKGDLDIQTKMTETIFLDPVAPDKRIAFISVRNSTDKKLNIKQRILQQLTESGYKVTDNPELATYIMQANVLKVSKEDLRNAESFIESGYSGAVIGSTVSSSSDSGKGALFGAILGVVVDALVDDTLYTMVTDIQVKERAAAGEVVTQQQTSDISQGTSTSVKQSTSKTTTNWKTYRTRIVSVANQANLKFDAAMEGLEDGLVKAISGIFAE